MIWAYSSKNLQALAFPLPLPLQPNSQSAAKCPLLPTENSLGPASVDLGWLTLAGPQEAQPALLT